MADNDGLLHRLVGAGQGHLAAYLKSADPETAATLAADVESVDMALLARMQEELDREPKPPAELRPWPYVPFAERYQEPGIEAALGVHSFWKGELAFALLAGGQASRLGWEGPKGAFPIGPKSQRSLFQVLVEHILRWVGEGDAAPLCVTTSDATHDAIVSFFGKHGSFGYDSTKVRFARQASLPALDERGRLILAAPDRLFRNPDGHGGAMTALETSGTLAEWESRGVRWVCTFQVDNPLLRVVDFEFLGRLRVPEPQDIVTKVVLKTDPSERVGLMAEVDGRPALVEYSELPQELAEARDPDGQLAYRLGSIAVHAFDLAFLRRELRASLPLHVARKEVDCVTVEGGRDRIQACKFERFLFDLFPRTERLSCVEVLREREFAPVKNREGNDSPATARAALEAEYRRWYSEAGRTPPEGPLELSPLDALGPHDLID